MPVGTLCALEVAPPSIAESVAPAIGEPQRTQRGAARQIVARDGLLPAEVRHERIAARANATVIGERVPGIPRGERLPLQLKDLRRSAGPRGADLANA